ncbi:MAG: hypothetical protein Q9191_003882 [Dirinaria sp. TL-2023a]
MKGPEVHLSISFVCLLYVLKLAVAVSNPNNNGNLVLPNKNSTSLNTSFQILPTSPSSSNLYWPLESQSAIPNPDTNNILVLPPNTSTLTTGQISCSGRLYGRNFRLASCLQIYELMSADRGVRTFGQRGTGAYEAPLPFRYLSADGLCAIDISHAAGVVSDSVAPGDLREAARVLINICVQGKPSEGGLMTRLGVNGGLALRVVRYKPSVTCGLPNSGPPWITCAHILDNMPADSQRRVFGPEGWQNTSVPLPLSYTTAQRRCGLVVDGTEPGDVSDATDWYKVWAAANAVNYMCVHGAKRGVSVGLGERGLLYVELKDVAQPDTVANASIAIS